MSARWLLNGWTTTRTAAKNRHGAVTVEFAIAAPMFLIFVMGLIDFGRLYWIKSTMQFAVEQTARYAMVNPSASTATLESYAEGESTVGGITFSATTSASGGINFRTITASYTFSFLIPIVPIGNISLAAKSSTPINNL
ncbi:TadE family protein [Magnetovibrio sp.]|uniref:TadE/TadG family type IV pilus assembly protein n=1 Tax=Magnetovibrio sp. TaxID=2024836 RepID=UPI002F92E4B7